MAERQQVLIEEAARLMNESRSTEPNEAVPHAVMRYIEGMGDFAGFPGRVTVGYGFDRKMYEGYGPGGTGEVQSWWDRFAPIEGRRFRIFIPDDASGELDRMAHDVMAAIGATPAGRYPNDDKDSYDSRGRTAYHYLLPDHAPIHQAVAQAARE